MNGILYVPVFMCVGVCRYGDTYVSPEVISKLRESHWPSPSGPTPHPASQHTHSLSVEEFDWYWGNVTK